MSQPPFTKLPLKSIHERNKPPGSAPIIGVSFDYRPLTAEAGVDSPASEFEYFEFIFNAFSKCIEKAGGQIYVIAPDEKPENLGHLDGLIIPGGRDMDPSHYGQELHEKTNLELGAALHFSRNKRLYEGLTTPVLGICWGMQFLNVIHGGDLVQHLDVASDHLNKCNEFLQTKGSFLESAISEHCKGFCYHHQGIGKIAPGFKVTSVDQAHNLPHGFEKVDGERKVFGVIWHPENVAMEDSECSENNIGCFEKIVELAREFRAKEEKSPKL